MDGVLMGNPKKHLKELSLGLLLNLTEAVVLRMSYVYENISALDLNGVSLAVTDHSLQMILRHMIFLRSLNVDSCCKVKHLVDDKTSPNEIESVKLFMNS